MRVLFDENLPRQLKRHLASTAEALTVQEHGWSGKKNSEVHFMNKSEELRIYLITKVLIQSRESLQIPSVAGDLIESP